MVGEEDTRLTREEYEARNVNTGAVEEEKAKSSKGFFGKLKGGLSSAASAVGGFFSGAASTISDLFGGGGSSVDDDDEKKKKKRSEEGVQPADQTREGQGRENAPAMAGGGLPTPERTEAIKTELAGLDLSGGQNLDQAIKLQRELAGGGQQYVAVDGEYSKEKGTHTVTWYPPGTDTKNLTEEDKAKSITYTLSNTDNSLIACKAGDEFTGLVPIVSKDRDAVAMTSFANGKYNGVVGGMDGITGNKGSMDAALTSLEVKEYGERIKPAPDPRELAQSREGKEAAKGAAGHVHEAGQRAVVTPGRSVDTQDQGQSR